MSQKSADFLIEVIGSAEDVNLHLLAEKNEEEWDDMMGWWPIEPSNLSHADLEVMNPKNIEKTMMALEKKLRELGLGWEVEAAQVAKGVEVMQGPQHRGSSNDGPMPMISDNRCGLFSTQPTMPTPTSTPVILTR